MCVCREGDVNPVDGEARTTLSLSLSPSVSLSRTHSVLGILEIVPPDITVYPPAFPPLFCFTNFLFHAFKNELALSDEARLGTGGCARIIGRAARQSGA